MGAGTNPRHAAGDGLSSFCGVARTDTHRPAITDNIGSSGPVSSNFRKKKACTGGPAGAGARDPAD